MELYCGLPSYSIQILTAAIVSDEYLSQTISDAVGLLYPSFEARQNGSDSALDSPGFGTVPAKPVELMCARSIVGVGILGSWPDTIFSSFRPIEKIWFVD